MSSMFMKGSKFSIFVLLQHQRDRLICPACNVYQRSLVCFFIHDFIFLYFMKRNHTTTPIGMITKKLDVERESSTATCRGSVDEVCAKMLNPLMKNRSSH